MHEQTYTHWYGKEPNNEKILQGIFFLKGLTNLEMKLVFSADWKKKKTKKKKKEKNKYKQITNQPNNKKDK